MSAKSTPSTGTFNLRRFLAGGLAGAVSKTCCAPLERTKIMLQASSGEHGSTLQVMRAVWRSEGLVGFWAGNLANCARVLPSKGILFMSNDMYKDAARRHLGLGAAGGESDPGAASTSTGVKLPVWASFGAGSLAGMTAVGLTYPLDLARARAAGTLNSRYRGLTGALRVTLAEEGWRGLFRGIGPTLGGALPFEGLKFCVFDLLASRLDRGADGKPSVAALSTAGAVAGTVAAVLVFPNDTVRRRCQMDRGEKYKGGFDCYRKLFAEQGIKAFYRGLSADLVRRVPSAAIQFVVYSKLKG